MRSLGAAQVGVFERGQMLKITGAANREGVFTVSGRLGAENLAELKRSSAQKLAVAALSWT